jgi:hypothetical protein
MHVVLHPFQRRALRRDGFRIHRHSTPLHVRSNGREGLLYPLQRMTEAVHLERARELFMQRKHVARLPRSLHYELVRPEARINAWRQLRCRQRRCHWRPDASGGPARQPVQALEEGLRCVRRSPLLGVLAIVGLRIRRDVFTRVEQVGRDADICVGAGKVPAQAVGRQVQSLSGVLWRAAQLAEQVDEVPHANSNLEHAAGEGAAEVVPVPRGHRRPPPARPPIRRELQPDVERVPRRPRDDKALERRVWPRQLSACAARPAVPPLPRLASPDLRRHNQSLIVVLSRPGVLEARHSGGLHWHQDEVLARMQRAAEPLAVVRVDQDMQPGWLRVEPGFACSGVVDAR